MKKVVRKKGFSVIELVVVISIFGIMTSISMFNYNGQKRSLEATDLAQDLALTIRQAQVYGISASGKNIGGAEGFDPDSTFGGENAFDITQDKSIRGVAIFLGDNKVILFEDNNRDYSYNKDIDRIIDERRITYVNTSFLSFVLKDSSEVEKDAGRVDIVFERPYPDAIISYSTDINGISAKRYGSVTINIGSEEYKKSVSVNSIGNIIVK